MLDDFTARRRHIYLCLLRAGVCGKQAGELRDPCGALDSGRQPGSTFNFLNAPPRIAIIDKNENARTYNLVHVIRPELAYLRPVANCTEVK